MILRHGKGGPGGYDAFKDGLHVLFEGRPYRGGKKALGGLGSALELQAECLGYPINIIEMCLRRDIRSHDGRIGFFKPVQLKGGVKRGFAHDADTRNRRRYGDFCRSHTGCKLLECPRGVSKLIPQLGKLNRRKPGLLLNVCKRLFEGVLPHRLEHGLRQGIHLLGGNPGFPGDLVQTRHHAFGIEGSGGNGSLLDGSGKLGQPLYGLLRGNGIVQGIGNSLALLPGNAAHPG